MKIAVTALSIISLFTFTAGAMADTPTRASKILTQEMAKNILGADVEARSASLTPDTELGKTWVSRVSYSAKSLPKSPSVGLLIRHAASKDEAKNIFEQSKATFKGEDVAGLGDACYRTKMQAQLNVLKGTNWLIITVGTFTVPDTSGQEKAAKEILPKIVD